MAANPATITDVYALIDKVQKYATMQYTYLYCVFGKKANDAAVKELLDCLESGGVCAKIFSSVRNILWRKFRGGREKSAVERWWSKGSKSVLLENENWKEVALRWSGEIEQLGDAALAWILGEEGSAAGDLAEKELTEAQGERLAFVAGRWQKAYKRGGAVASSIGEGKDRDDGKVKLWIVQGPDVEDYLGVLLNLEEEFVEWKAVQPGAAEASRGAVSWMEHMRMRAGNA